MNELIKINYESDRPTVLARDLHEFLEVKTAYKDWFPRMCEYGFAEGEDFNPLKNERVQIEGSRTVSRTIGDAQLTIDMAKEICMLQRNEKGKQNDFVKWLIARKYVYRDKRGRLMPYAEYVDSGLFEIKETYNEKTDWTGVQTLVTVKGKERFLKALS